jgi:hypothetical protein
MAEDHVKQLKAAREKLVAKRRELGSAIATGKTAAEFQQRFITLQAAIEAVDHALADEKPGLGRPAIATPIQVK